MEGSGRELSLGERLSSAAGSAGVEEVSRPGPSVRFSFRKRLLPLELHSFAGLDCGEMVGCQLARAANDAIAHDGGGFGWLREQRSGDLAAYFRGVSDGSGPEIDSPRSVLVVASEAQLWRTRSLDDGTFVEIAGRTGNSLDEPGAGAGKEESVAFG